MANTLLTPDLIARQAYANLYAQTHMAQLVHRDYEADFRGKQGDTVTIRKPATFTASTFARPAGITVQDATESGVAVTLNNLLDVSFAVTSEQLSLDLVNFNAQLLEPATEAIAQAIDAALLAIRTEATNTDIEAPETDIAKGVMVEAGRVLNVADVPASDRHLVAGTSLSADLLSDPLFHEADKRGDTSGLVEASIGRKFGFDTWQTTNIPATEGIAFHRTAFALVVRTLELPRGAQNAAVFGGDGFGIRVVQDYDIAQKQDVISLDVLIGVKTLDGARAVQIVDLV